MTRFSNEREENCVFRLLAVTIAGLKAGAKPTCTRDRHHTACRACLGKTCLNEIVPFSTAQEIMSGEDSIQKRERPIKPSLANGSQ